MTSSSLTLSWTAPSGTISNYIISMQTGGAGPFLDITLTVDTSYDVTGLAASTQYSFKIAANNSQGAGPFSNASSAVTRSSGAGT